MKFNPGLLKLELFCKGLRLEGSCRIRRDGMEPLRTRAGLGSGLEIILPGRVYVNAPVEEGFAQKSPLSLRKEGGKYCLFREEEPLCGVELLRRPDWYDRRTSSGTLMRRVGVLQGTYLAIYPAGVCQYWLMKPPLRCKFCSTGLNLGVTEEAEKGVEDVVETAAAAKWESGVTFVHFNSGYLGGRELEVVEPFVRAVRRETRLLVGVQCPPQKALGEYDRLIDAGTDHFSFCFEVLDRERFREVCPGKDLTLGQQAFFRALEYVARKMGKGRVSGEIVAGLEPVESTIKAIDYITSLGAFPTICIFRPLLGTEYEALQPPRYEEMLPVFRHMYQACKKRGIPTGIAPNLKVSIVVTPDEGRYFVERRGLGDWLYQLRLSGLRAAYRLYFRGKMGLFGFLY